MFIKKIHASVFNSKNTLSDYIINSANIKKIALKYSNANKFN